jgi:hypothetical protein
MKAAVQILHLVSLALISVLLLLFFKFSDNDHDSIRSFIDITFYVLAGSWSTIVFVSLVLNKEIDSKGKIISIYKRLLVNNLFLYPSTAILFIFNGILLYQLIFFRQVEFTAAGPAVIKVRLDSGEYADLAEVEPGEVIYKRMRIDDDPYKLVSIDKASEEINAQKLRVPFYWEDSRKIKCLFAK